MDAPPELSGSHKGGFLGIELNSPALGVHVLQLDHRSGQGGLDEQRLPQV